MSVQTRLFVGNIPENINDSTLREAFSSYGQIVNLEVKSKPGTDNDKRFAFITLAASNYDVESCIKNFSNLDFDGHYLYVTRARESFLERLQRERDQACKKDDEKRDINKSVPKEIPDIDLGSKHNHKRKFDVSSSSNENNYISNTKTYNNIKKDSSYVQPFDNFIEKHNEIDNRKPNSEKKRIDSLKIPDIDLGSKHNRKRKLDVSSSSYENNYISNTKTYNNVKKDSSYVQPFDNSIEKHNEIDNRKQNSEKKRIESLKKKRQEFKEKKMIIKTGLGGVDIVKNKKVIFSDNEEESSHNNLSLNNSSGHEVAEEKQINGKRNTLFDEDESDAEDVNFEIKQQFEGKKGQKVLDLQSRYKSDKRFTLDEKFLDEDQSDTEKDQSMSKSNSDEIDIGQSNEKLKQLNILQDVLGFTIKTNNSDAAQKAKPRLGMLRYDPMQPEHVKFLAPTNNLQEVSKKMKKKKSKENQVETAETESIVEKVEVSKEQFYKVSDTLKEAIIQPTAFSLRSLFSKEEDDIKEVVEQSTGHVSLPNEKKSRNPLDPGVKNPFVYDSSDSECEESKKDINVPQEKSEIKAVWRENLFFSVNDSRLKEGLLFFNKCGDNEGQKERRGLKTIMKKRIYNKERKNQMFQKKIGGRKKSMKNGMRKKR